MMVTDLGDLRRGGIRSTARFLLHLTSLSLPRAVLKHIPVTDLTTCHKITHGFMGGSLEKPDRVFHLGGQDGSLMGVLGQHEFGFISSMFVPKVLFLALQLFDVHILVLCS